MAKIEFTLVSPTKKLYSSSADMVVVPAESGDIGVMAGHTPVIATLRAGTIIIRDEDNETRLFVESGFIEVNEQSISILTEQGIEISKLDKTQANELFKQTENEFLSASPDDKELAKTKFNIAKARLDAIEKQYYQ